MPEDVTVGQPTPVGVDQMRNVNEKVDVAAIMEHFDRDTAYFEKHREELLRRFPDQWVAVYGERLVGAGPDRDALVRELRARGVPVEHTCIDLLETNPPILIL